MVDLPALFAAFNRRDWDRFDEVVDQLFTEDFALHLPKQGAPTVDRDAYPGVVRDEVERHDDLHYEVGAALAGDGAVALTLERTFRQGGRTVTVPVCLVAELDGDRIRTITEYAAAPRRT